MSGLRIDSFLARNFPFHTRNQWQKRLESGEVRVETTAVGPSYRLRAGDQISYFRPEQSEPDINTNVHVIARWGGIMAVYKPSNIPMHEGGRYHKNTFFDVVCDAFGKEWSAVHRLDRDTSGIVMCGATPELREKLSAELRKRTLKKHYLAIAIGNPKLDRWSERSSIGMTSETIFREKRWVTEDGLSAHTEFEVLDSADGFSLLHVSPKSGRTHQIRIHSSYIGLPLVGDPRYHPNEHVFLKYLETGYDEFVLDHVVAPRMCLHAAFVEFTNPETKKLTAVESPIPDDMAWIWGRLSSGERCIPNLPPYVL
jgi:23S rRNA pseudouridine1911/1915/1917 synthase